MIRMLALPIAILGWFLTVAAAHAQQVLIVDQNRGSGTDFTTIEDALRRG